MARIAGVNIPDNKHIVISLTSIYGIGPTRAADICAKADIASSSKVNSLSEDELEKVRQVIAELTSREGYDIEGDLRRAVAANIKNLKEIKCYRGQRHRDGLPLRGQKTKTNAKTCKKRRGSRK